MVSCRAAAGAVCAWLFVLLCGRAAPAVPPAPTDVHLVERSMQGALLEWTAPGPGVLGFKIRKSTVPGAHPDPTGFPGGKLAAFTWTTDDGYSDNLVWVPIFSSRGLAFTAFVSPGKIGQSGRLTWADLRSLHSQGHEVASHTFHHRSLVDDRAIAVRFVGTGPCTLSVVGDSLFTRTDSSSSEVALDLWDPAVLYLVDLAAALDTLADYGADLLYAPARQYATLSRFLDPVGGIPIGQGAPAGTLRTERGVHDDEEMRAEILDAQGALEDSLRTIDPAYRCRTLAYPNHAHRQWAISTLNELGYLACRDGSPGERPFHSQGSYAVGTTTTYEVPLTYPSPQNAWSEDSTRQVYRERAQLWKSRTEWALLMGHTLSECDSLHLEWIVDEIASDADTWIAPFGEVAAYLDSFYTDVGFPAASPGGTCQAWVHDLDPSVPEYVVVTAYDSTFQESAWSNEVVIPPAAVAVEGPHGAQASGETLPVAISPNPFADVVRIAFRIAEPSRPLLEIFDVRGSLVRRIERGPLPPGEVELLWDGRTGEGHALPAGLYLYRLRAGRRRSAGKLVLLR